MNCDVFLYRRLQFLISKETLRRNSCSSNTFASSFSFKRRQYDFAHPAHLVRCPLRIDFESLWSTLTIRSLRYVWLNYAVADQATQSGVRSELGSPTGRSIFNVDAEDASAMELAVLLRDVDQQWLHKFRLTLINDVDGCFKKEIFNYFDERSCKINSQ